MNLNPLIQQIKEDIGYGDITSQLLPDKNVKANIILKQDAYISGLDLVCGICAIQGIKAKKLVEDGGHIKKGTILIQLDGNVKTILSIERTILNLLQRMGGITTATRACVDVVGEKVRITGTRKTVMRCYDKLAIIAGGGDPHRWRLDDMFLIKDNHIKILGIKETIARARKISFTKKIEVEVEDKNQAIEAAENRADIIMFDNISPKEIQKIISHLKKMGHASIMYEASGGITFENLSEYATSGVDAISMGWLTHSVKAVDVSLEINGD